MFHWQLYSESSGQSIDLINHLKSTHKYLDGMVITCGFIDCNGEYGPVASFKKNLEAQHNISDFRLVEDIVQNYVIKLYGKNITREDVNEAVKDATSMTKSMTKLLKDSLLKH